MLILAPEDKAVPHSTTSRGAAQESAACRDDETGQWLIHVDCATRSDKGRRRQRNEDACTALVQRSHVAGGCLEPDNSGAPAWAWGTSLIVADGIGGYGDGDKASAEAVQLMYSFARRVLPWFTHEIRMDGASVGRELERAVSQAHRRIGRKARDFGLDPRMGTTLTFCYLANKTAHLAHVGDSRGYLFRDEQLTQITADHTMANLLVSRGHLDAAEVGPHHNHTLCNALGGGNRSVRVETHHVPIQGSDILLLCSDGLTKHVSDAEIAQILATGQPASWLCKRLVDAANAGGGSDNIAVAISRILALRSSHDHQITLPGMAVSR